MLDTYAYGSGDCDQLGIPDFDAGESKIPRKVPIIRNSLNGVKIYKIACGSLHTLVLTTMGQIYSWGCNDDSALGRITSVISCDEEGNGFEDLPSLNTSNTNMIANENILPETEPGLITTLTKPMENIMAGDSHSIAYNSELNLFYRWGGYRDTNGKLNKAIQTPELVETVCQNNAGIKQVACGANHTLVLSGNGNSLYAWGNPEFGQTGLCPTNKNNPSPLYPHKIPTTKHPRITSIFAGSNHSFLISDNKLKGWGLNTSGQLGVGDRTNYWIPQELVYFTKNGVLITEVTGGDRHSIYKSDKGEVYVCGTNDEGQCGVIPVKKENDHVISIEENVVMINDGTLDEKTKDKCVSEVIENAINEAIENANDLINIQNLQGGNDNNDNNNLEIDPNTTCIPLKLDYFNDKPITNIYSSNHFNYALDNIENKVYSWGMGYCYVLGNKNDDNEETPYEISKAFFKNLNVEQISLGSQHVVVALRDLNAYPEGSPILEYNVEEFKEKVEAKKHKTGKRKAVDKGITKEEEEEIMEQRRSTRVRRKPVDIMTADTTSKSKRGPKSRGKSKSKINKEQDSAKSKASNTSTSTSGNKGKRGKSVAKKSGTKTKRVAKSGEGSNVIEKNNKSSNVKSRSQSNKPKSRSKSKPKKVTKISKRSKSKNTETD